MKRISRKIRHGVQNLAGWVQRTLWALLSKVVKSNQMWGLIDATGIVCFVGPNGSGKSLAMVHAVLPVLDGVPWECDVYAHKHHKRYQGHVEAAAGGCGCDLRSVDLWCDEGQATSRAGCAGERFVYSTVPLLDEDGNDHPRFRPLTDYRDLLDIEHSDVLFDEVAGISDASDSQSMPVQVTNWLHKLRKADVRLRVTTPAYARCSKPIRQACQVVVDSRAFMPELRASGRLWRPRQGMLYRAFDAFEFADYSPSTGERLPSLARAAFWRPGSRASAAYDTLGQVLSLGHVTDSGMCAVCGGARRRPVCSCSHEVDDVPTEGLKVVETVSASGSRVRRAQLLPVVDVDSFPDGKRTASLTKG